MENHTKTIDFTHALKEGKLVFVDDVPNGIKCECHCPSCNQPLIAYNNPKNKKAHHFQHVSLDECRNYYETMIHYLAKEIIHEVGELIVPKHVFRLGDYARSYCFHDWSKDYPKEEKIPYILKFDNIQIEKFKNGIKPDLLCEVNGKEIHIEIAVTHFIDEHKEEKIKKLNVVSLEIDLSSFERDMLKDKLKEVLQGNIELMKWINNDSIIKARNNKLKIKRHIQDFIYDNSKEQKVYGKIKSVYKCPIIGKEYDISLGNCENCRYLANIHEKYEGTQDDYDNKTTIYPKISISCIGHEASKFDEILSENGIQIGKNKAFKGGVSERA